MLISPWRTMLKLLAVAALAYPGDGLGESTRTELASTVRIEQAPAADDEILIIPVTAGSLIKLVDPAFKLATYTIDGLDLKVAVRVVAS